MVSPSDDHLNDRVKQLKLRQVRVLSIVPTPIYDEQPEYKIIEMRVRSIDWSEYREQREQRHEAGITDKSQRPWANKPERSGGNAPAGGAGATQQGDSQPEQ